MKIELSIETFKREFREALTTTIDKHDEQNEKVPWNFYWSSK